MDALKWLLGCDDLYQRTSSYSALQSSSFSNGMPGGGGEIVVVNFCPARSRSLPAASYKIQLPVQLTISH